MTALINLPPGHKSPALLSVFHTATFTRVQGGRFPSESQSHQQKHRTQLYVRVYIYIYIYKTQEARQTLNNQITRRLSLISDTVVTHGTTMTDYKAFYLDYMPEEKIIQVQKQHFYPIKTRVDPYFASLL